MPALLLTAVTYVGQQRRGPHARGQRLMALYACMYFAALRPAEAVALRRQDCYLPATGWGRLTLEKSRPEVNLWGFRTLSLVLTWAFMRPARTH